MISIVLSTDAGGFGHNATLLGSILRRTSSEVRVRVYTRGFSQESFRSGPLSVEFIRSDEEVSGRYPRHVNEAVFDRLRIIRDFDDWDRVLVMDHDMVALCDLADYFDVDFGNDLLAGRLFGPGNTLGLQMNQAGGLPAGWEHCEDYPYFYMGPMMNLAAMRREGVWDRLLAAHTAIGRDEQISLTAATWGRVKGVDKKWNLVPQWDKLEEVSSTIAPVGETVANGVRWVNGVPEGIIHWTGWIKPWHHRSKAWRPELWEAEKTGWAQLRMGLWEKFRAVEIEPDEPAVVRSLVRRGWKVDALSGLTGDGAASPGEEGDMPHPDLRWYPPDYTLLPPLLDPVPDLIRFGPGSKPEEALAAVSSSPETVVLQGPRTAAELASMGELGYVAEARILRKSWPVGGPHPKVLSYRRHDEAAALSHEEDVYLRRDPSAPRAERSSCCTPVAEEVDPEFERFLLERLPGWSPMPGKILVLGCGPHLSLLAGIYPGAPMLAIDHERDRVRQWQAGLPADPRQEILHLPLDPALPWYDLGALAPSGIDLLVLAPPAPGFGRGTRPASVSLLRSLNPGAVVAVAERSAFDGAECVGAWENAGFELMEDDEGVAVLQAVSDPADDPFKPAFPSGATLSGVVEAAYVISLPERSDRRELLARNWRETVAIRYEIVDGIRVDPSEVRWEEMKGMEAYGKMDRLRGDYVPAAAGCKRAGIRALRHFLASGTQVGLICQDDCLWKSGATGMIARGLAELPADWDLLYFSASARLPHLPVSPHLVRLQGARLCTSVLWRRDTALRLLPVLESCDCEWDLFMQRSHRELNAYAVVPMPAYQAKTRSDILGISIQPGNR